MESVFEVDSIMISRSQATTQIFGTASQAMSIKERNAIVEKFLTEGEFMENLVDAVILNSPIIFVQG